MLDTNLAFTVFAERERIWLGDDPCQRPLGCMKLQAESVSIELAAVRKADAEDWTRVWVSVRSLGFTGEFEAWLQREDLRRFAGELMTLHNHVELGGNARLCSAEPDIDVELRMNGRGQIQGNYTLESERREGVPTYLSGYFTMDQSYLPELAKSVQILVEALS
jgi:hypothetical protein